MTASSETPMPRSLEERSATLCALQPVYSALVREFVIEVSTCPIDEDFVTSGETVKQALPV